MQATAIGNGNGTEPSIETESALLLPRLIILDREKPLSWYLLPQVVARVRRFCDNAEHRTDSKADVMARWIEKDFTADKPTILLMAAEEDGVVVGHLFACLMKNEFSDCQYMHIWQYEVDKEGVPTEYLQAGFEEAVEWAQAKGASEIRLECSTEKLARLYKLFYSFEPWRLIMRKEI